MSKPNIAEGYMTVKRSKIIKVPNPDKEPSQLNSPRHNQERGQLKSLSKNRSIAQIFDQKLAQDRRPNSKQLNQFEGGDLSNDQRQTRFVGWDSSGRNAVIVENKAIKDPITGRTVVRPQSSLIRVKRQPADITSRHQETNIINWTTTRDWNNKRCVSRGDNEVHAGRVTADRPGAMERVHVGTKVRVDIITGRILSH